MEQADDSEDQNDLDRSLFHYNRFCTFVGRKCYANMLSEIELVKDLLKINAIKLSPDHPFTWASGLKSPIYCDNRLTLSYPDMRNAIKVALAERSSKLWTFDKVVGVATAGIAHGALVADHLSLPFAYVRSKPKGHGRQNQIEGKIHTTDRCLVIEDLISTGGSSIAAVEMLRDTGASVCGVAAIFSYELSSAHDNFERSNCPYITLSNYNALINTAKDQKLMSVDQIRSLVEWRRDPKSWSKLIE